MNRISEDGVFVYGDEGVWEIVYNYLNPEISVCEPRMTLLESLPPNIKVWCHLSTIQAICNAINKTLSPNTSTHPIHVKELSSEEK